MMCTSSKKEMGVLSCKIKCLKAVSYWFWFEKKGQFTVMNNYASPYKDYNLLKHTHTHELVIETV